MCLIIDVNVAHRVFGSNNDSDFKAVHDALFGRVRKARVVIGGKLAREYQKSSTLRRVYLQLERRGRGRKVNDDLVDRETQAVANLAICKSNDHHVIALARVGHIRLLCTHDRCLVQDFTNPLLVSNPRGKVYQKSNHRSLIGRYCRRL